MTSPNIAKQLARLTRMSTGEHRVISCYLKLEPRDRSRGKYLIKLKNRVRLIQEAVEALDIPRATREQVKGDLERIVRQHFGDRSDPVPVSMNELLLRTRRGARW